MTKQASIAYITDLLENPSRITEADLSSIAGFRQSFPYFVPARYLEAANKHRLQQWDAAMMSAISPFVGNWILFCEFLNAGTGHFDRAGADNAASAVDDRPILKAQKVITVHPAAKAEPGVESNAENQTPEAEAVTEEAVHIAAQAVVIEDISVEGTLPVTDDAAITTVTEAVSAATEAETANTLPEVPASTEEVVVLLQEQIVVTNIPSDEPVATVEANVIADAAEPEPKETETVAARSDKPADDTQDLSAIVDALEQRHNDFWTFGEDDTNADADAGEMPETESIVAIDADEPPAVSAAIDALPQVEEIVSDAPVAARNEKPLIYPVYTEDYFLQQGEKISAELPEDIDSFKDQDPDRSLMVMMSFSEWLLHFKSTTERQKEENKDQKALKTMWQKEKLAAAIEEENEEIPENVFEMAVNSITREDGLASESLADIYIKQGKLDKAVDMYRKLSLRNPQKSAYFARKIDELQKEK